MTYPLTISLALQTIPRETIKAAPHQMQGGFAFSVRCCMNGYDTLSRRCGSGADRIAAVTRLRRESDTASHTAEKVAELQGDPAGRRAARISWCGRVTPLFFHNVLDKKQQSAIISTKALDRFFAVSP